MLSVPINSFQASADLFGTWTEGGLGVTLTGGGTNHTKNSTITSVIAAQTWDIYGVAIMFLQGFSAGSSRRYLTDIFTDPAGGTSWGSTPIIENLGASSVSITQGGKWYYFPLHIKAGASIGARCQAETASATVRIAMRVFGKPSRPEGMVYGTKVLTYGAVTASTQGTAMTPGSNGAKGSYSASLATISDDILWWQFCMMINDTTQVANFYANDVAIGDASNKILVMRDSMHFNVGTGEVSGAPMAFSDYVPQYLVKNGANVYIRSACGGTPDSTISGIVYGVAR